MNRKAVCYYCGTLYDEERGKCPLCGSTARAADQQPPIRRERLTEEERKHRKGGTKGKFSAPKKKQESPKGILIAAVVFLALAVLVVFYFIGDMIGWWPGLEDRVERSEPSVSFAKGECEELLLSSLFRNAPLYRSR